MSQLQVTGEAKIREIQGPVVANSGVISALNGGASQYVRGDGTLADFPTSTGGGSSVSYYLNSSVSQGTIGGVAYRQLSKTPISGAGTDITASTNGYIANYITDANDPSLLEIPAGNFNCEFYFSVNSNNHNPYVYAQLYKYDGTTFTLLGSNQAIPEYLTNGTTLSAYYFAIPVAVAALNITDRLAIRIYVNVDGRVVTLHTENNHLCQVVTTFSKGLISLNNLTRQNQFFATGTSGTDFNISSSTATHTFNLPVASAANTGKLSSTDWSTFNSKQNALTNPITGTGASTQIAYFNGTTSITSEAAFNYDASTNRLGVNTSVPNATIGANAGIDSGYSLLLKNDNANYNGIGFGTDSTYGNLISTEKLGTALARNLTLLNQSGYISLTEAGNLGVNILNPNTGVDIYNGTSAYLWLHTANSGITGTDGVRLALFSTNGANLRNFDGSFSITAEGDFSIITIGAENFRINSSDGSIYQSKVANAMLKSVSGVITAAVAGTDYLAPAALSGYVPTSRTLTINGTTYDLSANRSWTITSDITGSGADGRVAYWNGTNSITSEAGFIYDASTNRLGVNTSVPNATIGADSALDSGYGLLIKTGASNYNGIGLSIDSTYGNLISTEKLGTASARNLTLLNQSGFVSLTESGNFGVGILTPNNGIDIYNSTQSQLWLHNAASGITGTDGVRLALFNNLSANLRNFDGALSLTAEGDFSIITIGTENLKVNSANGFVAIGGPATITSMLTVNGAITQSSVTSALLKTNASGTLVAAVAGTDYVAPSGLSGYLPLSGGTMTGAITLVNGATGINVGDDATISDGNIANTMFLAGLQNSDRGYINFSSTSGNALGATNGGNLTWRGNNVGTVTSVGLSSATTGVTIGSSPITTSGTITLAIATASGSQQGLLSSTDWTTFNNKASTAALANYLPLSGGTLTGALNGTSASFSSTLTAGDTTIINVAPILAIQSNTTGNIFLRFRQSADTMASLFYTNATGSFTMSNNMGGLRFNTSGTSDALNISSSGAATFSSRVYANTTGLNSDFNAGAFIAYGASSTTKYTQIGFDSTSNYGWIQALNQGVSYNNLILNGAGGNVGIATIDPQLRLHVVNTQTSNSSIVQLRLEGNGGNYFDLGRKFDSGAFVIQGNQTGANNITLAPTSGNVLIGTTSDNGAKFQVATTSSFNGDISMGACNITWGNSSQGILMSRSGIGPKKALYADGGANLHLGFSEANGWTNIYATATSNGVYLASGGVAWIANSDERLKTDLVAIEDAANKVSSLRSVIGRYKTDKIGTKRAFLIAQDVLKVLPEAVTEEKETGNLGVSYSEVIPLLVAAIKEIKAEIDQLKNK